MEKNEDIKKFLESAKLYLDLLSSSSKAMKHMINLYEDYGKQDLLDVLGVTI